MDNHSTLRKLHCGFKSCYSVQGILLWTLSTHIVYNRIHYVIMTTMRNSLHIRSSEVECLSDLQEVDGSIPSVCTNLSMA
jgi:hypothetical protein